MVHFGKLSNKTARIPKKSSHSRFKVDDHAQLVQSITPCKVHSLETNIMDSRPLLLFNHSNFFNFFIPQVKKQHMERDVKFLVEELKVVTEQEAADRVFFVSAKEALITRTPKVPGTPDSSGPLAEGYQARLFAFENFERKFEVSSRLIHLLIIFTHWTHLTLMSFFAHAKGHCDISF